MNQAMRLLLVDGHGGVRTALAARLRQDPRVAAVATAATLDEGLQQAGAYPPDVVLYDPRTVPGDPVAAVGRLAQEGRRVVVLTSSLWADEGTTLRQAGAAALLFKGLTRVTLLACLEEVRAGQPPEP